MNNLIKFSKWEKKYKLVVFPCIDLFLLSHLNLLLYGGMRETEEEHTTEWMEIEKQGRKTKAAKLKKLGTQR